MVLVDRVPEKDRTPPISGLRSVTFSECLLKAASISRPTRLWIQALSAATSQVQVAIGREDGVLLYAPLCVSAYERFDPFEIPSLS